jgi:RNA polymerase sigma factor (sigma-70 family)
MKGDDTTQLQNWIDRMNQGDPAARRELVGHSYERLCLLARKIFHEDFFRLYPLHTTQSILHEAAPRLLHALEEVRVPTVRDFFTFAATHIRWVLLDMAKWEKRKGWAFQQNPAPAQDASGSGADLELSYTTLDPAELAMWTEFHEKVDTLPAEERAVVDMYYYQGLTQEETGELLGISQKEVSRRWIKAQLKLSGWVPGGEQLSD